jgi:hypothetical protein
VEETTAACHGLSGDAHALTDLIRAFDYSGGPEEPKTARRA